LLTIYGLVLVFILAIDVGCKFAEHKMYGIRLLAVVAVCLSGYAFSRSTVTGCIVASLTLALSLVGYLLGKLLLQAVDARIMKDID
jgi:hypothetical protein